MGEDRVRVIVNSGKEVRGLSSGKKGEIIIKRPIPAYVIDSHTHIQSGACAPLPILWERIPGGLEPNRDTLNVLSYAVSPLAAEVQSRDTFNIGDKLVEEMRNTYEKSGEVKSFYGDKEIFGVSVVQMMDMEYGWIGGYEGKRIYQEDGKGPWYFYRRKRVKDPVEKWEKVYLPGENEKSFVKWERQCEHTKEALIKNPLRLIGMYHYEPRRWKYGSKEEVDENLNKGPWDYPFKEIVSCSDDGLFVGFKMYPPLGYKPLDRRLRYLYDSSIEGDCFYSRCEREGIPILVHCSPGGVRSYEYNLYVEYDGGRIDVVIDEGMSEETKRRYFTEEGYFYLNYVHPGEWRKVLEKYPELRICLAHFGGEEWEFGLESDWIREIIDLTREYKNVYTDVSCWDIERFKKVFGDVLTNKRYVHLRDKLLFGTDWYMPLISWRSYRSFCEDFCEFFREIKGGIDIWERITFVNPVRFYGFFEKDKRGKDKIDYLYERLKGKIVKERIRKELEKNYRLFREAEKNYKERIDGRG